MAKYKHRKKLQLDKLQCILLLIFGLLLGSVFTFGMGYWNAAIAPADAIAITTEDTTLLPFEDAMKQLSFERWGFFCIGLFCCIWAGIGAYYLIAKKYY